MNAQRFSRKLGRVLLVVEFALAIAAIVVVIGLGWDHIIQPLQVLVILIIMTVLSMFFEEICNDYEEKEKTHPGTYHEIQT